MFEEYTWMCLFLSFPVSSLFTIRIIKVKILSYLIRKLTEDQFAACNEIVFSYYFFLQNLYTRSLRYASTIFLEIFREGKYSLPFDNFSPDFYYVNYHIFPKFYRGSVYPRVFSIIIQDIKLKFSAIVDLSSYICRIAFQFVWNAKNVGARCGFKNVITLTCIF